MYGPTVAAVVQRFAQLTGYPAFPPRWSLGYLASGMTYSEVRKEKRKTRNQNKMKDYKKENKRLKREKIGEQQGRVQFAQLTGYSARWSLGYLASDSEEETRNRKEKTKTK
jgi:hypothetical protein